MNTEPLESPSNSDPSIDATEFVADNSIGLVDENRLDSRKMEPPRHNRFVDLPQKKWQVLWAWLSERANPIVVKEARQSLNSRQFVFSYSLTLIAIVCWTAMAVVMQLPQLYYVPGGMVLLGGYMVILACPLLLIIPYSAFRSMVVEAEDRTFELVSISALSAQQIVNGKMYSSMLQSIVYLATLTPCFVITYLLRGVLLSSILYYLIFSLLISITLTALCLLIATLGRTKSLQVLSSIFALAGLLLVFFMWSSLAASNLQLWDLGEQGPIFVIAFATSVAALVPVCLRSATAAIDFASENNATPLRIRIALMTLVGLIWGVYGAAASREEEFFFIFVIGGAAVFFIIGSLTTAELGIISPRAQRSLPKTVLGRVFSTWFFPGAGLGYVFLTCLFSCYIASWFSLTFGTFRGRNTSTMIPLCIAMLSYFVFFVGLNRLVMLVVPRSVNGRMLVGLLSQAILISSGSIVPFLCIYILNGFGDYPYEWHQFSNLFWTLSEILNGGNTSSVASALFVLVLSALGVFALNLILCGRDVMLIRTKLPERVEAEMGFNKPVVEPSPDPFA